MHMGMHASSSTIGWQPESRNGVDRKKRSSPRRKRGLLKRLLKSGGSQAVSPAQEALFAEAAKLLKGVSLKPLHVDRESWQPAELEVNEIDKGWLRSAVSHASDPN